MLFLLIYTELRDSNKKTITFLQKRFFGGSKGVFVCFVLWVVRVFFMLLLHVQSV